MKPKDELGTARSIAPTAVPERTELTLSEFSEALRMRQESEFVMKMFALVDKDKNGFISLKEFIDLLLIFANGSGDDKAKLIFDMYDVNGNGLLTRNDVTNMIK